MHHSQNDPRIYFFVGPEKTGTTTIFDMLPFVRRPQQKETFNLSSRQSANAEWTRIERQAKEQSQVFIVEPTYFVSEYARVAIAQLQNRFEVHVIHTRRDPVARSISHYLHHKLKGRVRTPSEAVKVYPEIIEASDYDRYSSKWNEVIHNFHIVDIAKMDLRHALSEIGISTVDNSADKSNPQLAPKYIWVSKISTLTWGMMIKMRLNLLVPSSVKNYLKKLVYYSGKRATISDQEREYIARCLSATH